MGPEEGIGGGRFAEIADQPAEIVDPRDESLRGSEDAVGGPGLRRVEFALQRLDRGMFAPALGETLRFASRLGLPLRIVQPGSQIGANQHAKTHEALRPKAGGGTRPQTRKSVEEGKRWSVRVDRGGARHLKKKKKTKKKN